MRLTERFFFPAVLVGMAALAVYFRLRGIAAASALGDAIHPWWAAMRDGWPRPHATPFGWGLVPPYQLCLLGVANLWEAVSRMLVLHAMLAPLAVVVAWAFRRGAWVPAVLVGLLVSVDSGLIDTALSGAEGHLAPLFIGLLTLGVAGRDRWWGPVLAGVSFSMAVMHHPLAVAGAPILLCLRLVDRRTWVGLAFGLLCLLPRLIRFAVEDLPGGSGQGAPTMALDAYLVQGGAGAWAVLAGPLVGLCHRRTRGLAAATLLSGGILFGLGLHLDYLRDHHIRLLTVPALMGWLGPAPTISLGLLLFLRLPPHPVQPAGHIDRPGTLGLTHLLTDRVAQENAPLVVDGAWLSGGPAASPAALMLDLYLRGWTRDQLTPRGDVVVLVSGGREEIRTLAFRLEELSRGDRHLLLRGTQDNVAVWSQQFCEARTNRPRLGGAYDALSVLHPEMGVEHSRTWWACP